METLVASDAAALLARRQTLATAESCTGGLVGALLTGRPGSSAWYLGGIVAYANDLKLRLLGVPADVLAAQGAVSLAVAEAMAAGARAAARSDYAVSLTGIAGPDGGTPEKPAGTVWIACSALQADGTGLTRAMLYKIVSDRHGVRLRASHAALDLLRRTLLGLQPSRAFEERSWTPGNGGA